MKYKIDNIPIKELEIKFIATLENGETINLLKGINQMTKTEVTIICAFFIFFMFAIGGFA